MHNSTIYIRLKIPPQPLESITWTAQPPPPSTPSSSSNTPRVIIFRNTSKHPPTCVKPSPHHLSSQLCAPSHPINPEPDERAIPGERNASQITGTRIKPTVGEGGRRSVVTFRRPEPFCPITGGALMQPSEKITGCIGTHRYRSDRPMREVNSGEPTAALSLCSCQRRILKGWIGVGRWPEGIQENVNRENTVDKVILAWCRFHDLRSAMAKTQSCRDRYRNGRYRRQLSWGMVSAERNGTILWTGRSTVIGAMRGRRGSTREFVVSESLDGAVVSCR